MNTCRIVCRIRFIQRKKDKKTSENRSFRGFPHVRCEGKLKMNYKNTLCRASIALSIDACISCIAFNKFTTWSYVITHQHREDVISVSCIFYLYLL